MDTDNIKAMQEKREYPRLSVTVIPLKMKIIDDKKEARHGIIKGIGAGGLGIEMQEQYDVDDLVLLSFILDQGYEFNDLKGKVVRVEKSIGCSIIGVQFVDITQDDRTKIKQYVNRELQKKDSRTISLKNIVIFK